MQNININIRGLLTEVVELVAKEYIKPLQERVEMLERQRATDEIADLAAYTPLRQVHWANDYGDVLSAEWHDNPYYADRRKADATRIAVIRREWVPGQPPQYFTENV
jgi:hypothetical protein